MKTIFPILKEHADAFKKACVSEKMPFTIMREYAEHGNEWVDFEVKYGYDHHLFFLGQSYGRISYREPVS